MTVMVGWRQDVFGNACPSPVKTEQRNAWFSSALGFYAPLSPGKCSAS